MAMSECPRCDATVVSSDVGAGVGRCATCSCFVCTDAARQNLCRFLRVDEAVWRSLLEAGGKGPRCPGCAHFMKVATLKGVVVDGCLECGVLLLDPGELHRLTGRDEGPVAAPVSTTSTTTASLPEHERLPGREFAAPIEVLRNFLGSTPWVQVSQQRQQVVAGGLFVVDGGKTYFIRTAAGSGTLRRQEDATALLKRMFLGAFVKQRFVMTDPRGQPMIVIDRTTEKVVMNRLVVSLDDGTGDPGRALGSVESTFSVIETRYELRDARGTAFANVVRPALSSWTFELRTMNNAVVGRVAKEWSGVMTEWLSDSDDFAVDFGAHPWTLDQRGVIVAAALLIDINHFERGNTSHRSSWFDLVDLD
jgi:Zn-finger nucleic acid-binding protein